MPIIGTMRNISKVAQHSDAVTRRQGSMSPSKIRIVRILELIDCGTSSDVVGQRVPFVNSSHSEEVLSDVKVVTGFDKVSSSCSVVVRSHLSSSYFLLRVVRIYDGKITSFIFLLSVACCTYL